MINEAIEMSGKAVSTMGTVLDRIEKYKKIEANEVAFLRALYLEVITNIEIFNAVDLKEVRGSEVSNEKIGSILDLLETELMEGIFYQTSVHHHSDIYERLTKQEGVIEWFKGLINTDGEELEGEKAEMSILKAISFVVIKTKLLRKLQQVDADLPLKKLRIYQRLVNIKQRLLLIRKELSQFDEIINIVK